MTTAGFLLAQMLNRLKLGQKAFLLVGLPLAFELIFAGALFSLLNDAENDVIQTKRTHAIVAKINKIFIDVFELAVMFRPSKSTDIPIAETASLLASVREDLLSLEQLCSDVPEHLKRVKAVRQAYDSMLSRMGGSGRLRSEDIDGKEGRKKSRAERAALSTIAFELEKIRRDHEDLDMKRLESETEKRKQLINLLYAGSAINVILALILVSLFNKNIVRRLNHLISNTYLLSIGKPLNPPMPGADEIAHLDKTFRNVAEELMKAMKKQQAIFQDVADVICSIEIDGTITEISQSASRSWGYEPQDLLATNLFDLVVANEASAVKEHFQSIASQGGKTELECRLRKRNGPIINVLWSISWSESEQSLFCVAHDITERKQNEDLLVEAETRLSNMVESMPIGLIMTNRAGIIKMLNPTAESMFGVDRNAVFDHSLSEFLELEEFDQQAGSPGEELPGTTRETIATRSNGQKFPAEISISMIRTFEGKQAMILVVDITERHEIEAMKRRFVAMVSHELKTPLTSVQNYLELLDKGTYGTLNEKGEKTLKKVDDNLNRLTNLIEELLDIERLEQGSLKLSKSIIDLEDIFDLAMENIRAASKNKEIEIKMPETNLKLLADRDRLVQVLINLLVNAIKFSGKGTIIEVGLVEGVESLTISVSDQGRGIPREFIDKIFERYQQVNLEDSVRHGGAGLGLAICKEIITLHGGKIGCDSEAGKGSRFWFELPNLHV